VQDDPATGNTVGWQPAEQSPFFKYLYEALSDAPDWGVWDAPGTYELCGPRINGNPEQFERHMLIRHDTAQPFAYTDRTFAAIRDQCLALREVFNIEGIVWHHPDGRMAKIKGRDFRG
jgi:hypothetical protein